MQPISRFSRVFSKSLKPFNWATIIRRQNSSLADQFSGIGRLNHIAIACPDLKSASDMYRNVLRAEVSDEVDLPEHGVTTVFITLNNTKIELLHPFGDNSPIAGFLEKNKSGGMHHICLEVDDIEAAVAQLKKENKRVLGDIKIGAHGLPVIFVHPKDMGGVLVELEQVPNKK